VVLRFHHKLSIFIVLLLLIVQFGSIGAVYWHTSKSALTQVRQQLNYTGNLVQEQLDDYSDAALRGARKFAITKELKEALSTNDPALVFPELHRFGGEIAADRLMLISPAGNTVLDTDLIGEMDAAFPFQDLLKESVRYNSSKAIRPHNDTIYQWVIVPMNQQGKIWWLAIAYEIEPILKKYLTNISALDIQIAFAYEETAKDWQFTRDAKEKLAPAVYKSLKNMPLQTTSIKHITIGDNIILSHNLVRDQTNLNVVSYLVFSFTAALQPYLPLLYGLIGIAVIGLFISLFGAILIARNITKPIQNMVVAINRIDKGDYSEPIAVSGNDEINKLAITFNDMMVGIDKREKELLYSSNHDTVTGLPNRNYFIKTLSAEMKKTNQNIDSIGIMVIGIDRFPQINHALGHGVGDRLLKHIGERLTRSLPGNKMIARLSSNVFILLYPGMKYDDVEKIAHKVSTIFEKPFSVFTVNIDISAHMGFSFYPTHGEEAEVLVQRADVALYTSSTASEGYAIYETEKDPHKVNKLSLMSELREGLAQDEFEVYYQPKIDLKTDKICAVEALIRWHHPEKGFMPPDLFIPLAEQTGNIKRLSLWLLEKTISQMGRWHRSGLDISMSINLSVHDLLNKELIPKTMRWIEEHRVDPETLILEITESAFMSDPDSALKALAKLGEKGFKFAIDDFGTGYSSMSYLKQLPADELKIDKAFVQEITQNEKDAQIVRSTIELGHGLNLHIVAEGVEDDESRIILRDFGCDIGQGYFFGKPMNINDFHKWLAESKWGIQPEKPLD
jgi:diguanylate cyclase (GGDEF)-like protein